MTTSNFSSNFVGSHYETATEIVNAIYARLMRQTPSVLLAGKHSGKRVLGSIVSHYLRSVPQLYIGEQAERFSDYAEGQQGFVHYTDLQSINDRVLPTTIVIADGLLHWDTDGYIFDTLLELTNTVVVMDYKPTLDWHWIDECPEFVIGPYASWELNPKLDELELRKRMAQASAEDRQRFNIECAACNNINWRTYCRAWS